MDGLNTKHITPIREDLVPVREDWWIVLILSILHPSWRTWCQQGGLVDRLNTVHITFILDDLVPARGDWWIDLILYILHLSWRTWC